MKKLLKSTVPAELLGRVEFYTRRRFRRTWGGAMNGQEKRRGMVEELFSQFDFRAIVETGTYRGTTTSYFAEQMRVPITSIEVNPRYAAYATLLLRPFDNVSIHKGNSTETLRRLVDDGAIPTENVFFYLDAHWEDFLPLEGELDIIVSEFSGTVVLIDDFQVPNDTGYGYGICAGKTLDVELLRPLDRFGAVAFPRTPSSEENGAVRGSVVVTSPDIGSDILAKIEALEIYREAAAADAPPVPKVT